MAYLMCLASENFCSPFFLYHIAFSLLDETKMVKTINYLLEHHDDAEIRFKVDFIRHHPNARATFDVVRRVGICFASITGKATPNE